MSILCFFPCITATAEKNKAKTRRRRTDLESSEEDGKEFNNNSCDMSFWTVIK